MLNASPDGRLDRGGLAPRRRLGYGPARGQGIGLVADQGDGLGEMLGCGFLVHGVLPPTRQPSAGMMTRGCGARPAAPASPSLGQVESRPTGTCPDRPRHPSLVACT